MHRSGSVARRRKHSTAVGVCRLDVNARVPEEPPSITSSGGAQPFRFAPRATEPTSELAGLKTAGGG